MNLIGNTRFLIELKRGAQRVSWKIHATPTHLVLDTVCGQCRMAIIADDTLAMESDGPEIELSIAGGIGLPYIFECLGLGSYGIAKADGTFAIFSQPTSAITQVKIYEGKGVLGGKNEWILRMFNTVTPLILRLQELLGKKMTFPQGILPRNFAEKKRTIRVGCEKKRAACLVRIAPTEAHFKDDAFDFSQEIEKIEAEWSTFRMPKVPERYADMALVSQYALWSSMFRSGGNYAYDAILMSKKYMTSVWSWDHCFNALAVSRVSKKTALEQFLLPFELQADNGMLPDAWNAKGEVFWGVTKPPIHGWCFKKLMEQHTFTEEELQKVYTHLEKWTMWWLTYRDADQDGVPEYPQGCDSGWDNATLFDSAYFMEAPDLSAFLVLQMHTLADICVKLNRTDMAAQWREHADMLRLRMIEHSWEGGQFVTRESGTHRTPSPQTSLLNLISLVLGEYLDKDKFQSMVKLLEQDFLTEHGLATEMPRSPYYQQNGYWRGPIWAPSTYLIVDGLRRAGYTDLAREIAKRFCDMIQFKAHGNYENFDALTGKGLCDSCYTWTASVFLLMVWEYLA